MSRQWVLIFSLFMAVIVPLSHGNEGTDENVLLNTILPEHCHFSAQFTQRKNVEGVPAPLTSTGNFFYSCDLGLIWHSEKPFAETILYVNSVNNYRVQDGSLRPLSGITRYIMSNVVVKLLKGETDYFIKEFAIVPADDKMSVMLKPEGEFMQKGIKSILFKKHQDTQSEVTLTISVLDTTDQETTININNINVYDLEGKRQAFEQCETLYNQDEQWCQVLRAPSRANQR